MTQLVVSNRLVSHKLQCQPPNEECCYVARNDLPRLRIDPSPQHVVPARRNSGALESGEAYSPTTSSDASETTTSCQAQTPPSPADARSQRGRMGAWQDMPESLGIYMTSHLSPLDLKGARSVCKSWRATTTAAVKHLQLTWGKHSDADLLSWPLKFPCVSSLNLNLGAFLSNRPNQDIVLRLDEMPGLGRLGHLTIDCKWHSNCLEARSLEEIHHSAIRSIGDKLRGLTSLEVLNSGVNGHCLVHWPQSLPATIGLLTNLRHLSVGQGCLRIQSLDFLGNLTRLESLALEDMDFEGAASGLGPLRSLSGLTRLSLNYGVNLDGLEDEGIGAIGCLANLTHLSLNGTEMSGNQLGPALRHLTKLTALESMDEVQGDRCNYGAVVTDSLLQGVSDLPALKVLRLSDYCEATPAGIRQVSRMRCLESLEISSSWMGDVMMKVLDETDEWPVCDAFLDAIAPLKTLRKLDIGCLTKCSDSAVSRCLSQLPALESVTLVWSCIEDGPHDDWVSALPKFEASSLKAMNRIEALTVSGDVFVEDIAELRHLTGLKHVSIDARWDQVLPRMRLTDSDVLSLCRLTRLRTLNLGTPIEDDGAMGPSEEAWTRLSQSCPDLEECRHLTTINEILGNPAYSLNCIKQRVGASNDDAGNV